MREAFLHYLWKNKKFNPISLRTTDGEEIVVKSIGEHNHNSGPDFLNAQLRIGKHLWVGNVEMHLKSSDWFLHQHETDKLYDNVILHVVWEHDADIHRIDQSKIPTLALSEFVENATLVTYRKLFLNKTNWINCEKDIEQIDDQTYANWLQTLFIERLEEKSIPILRMLEDSRNDWEAVLFKVLLKYFGSKVNGEAFLSLGNSMDFSIVRRCQSNLLQLEALLFGQANLLNDKYQGLYPEALFSEYNYLKHKFKLSNHAVQPVQFFRLRPSNFPTLRLSQFANLLVKSPGLFARCIEINSVNDFYKLLESKPSEFWQSHYSFDRTSDKSDKKITKPFIDLLIINAIIPIKYTHAKLSSDTSDKHLLELVKRISAEKNGLVTRFLSLKKIQKTALNAQGLIQLKTRYCNKNKCLQCAIGNKLLSQN